MRGVNVRGGIRTHDPRIRNPVLYPAELRRHIYEQIDSIDSVQRECLDDSDLEW